MSRNEVGMTGFIRAYRVDHRAWKHRTRSPHEPGGATISMSQIQVLFSICSKSEDECSPTERLSPSKSPNCLRSLRVAIVSRNPIPHRRQHRLHHAEQFQMSFRGINLASTSPFPSPFAVFPSSSPFPPRCRLFRLLRAFLLPP